MAHVSDKSGLHTVALFRQTLGLHIRLVPFIDGHIPKDSDRADRLAIRIGLIDLTDLLQPYILIREITTRETESHGIDLAPHESGCNILIDLPVIRMDLLRKTSVGDLHMLDLAVFFQGKLRRTVYQIPKPRVDLTRLTSERQALIITMQLLLDLPLLCNIP